MTIENIEVKVGDEIRFGMQLMIVDEITEFDTIIAVDEDGQDFELTENEIDISPTNIARWASDQS